MVVLPLFSWSQVCQPDTTIQANNGIFPDSATGIPPAFEGVLYQQTVTIITPADTQAVIVPGTPAQTVLIDSIVLDSVFTLPAWLSYDCEPVDCAFIGGESGCLIFYGSPPAGEAGKSYSINFITRSHGRLLLFPTSPLPAQIDTTFNYYTLEVAGATDVEIANSQAFRIYPNPTKEGFYIEQERQAEATLLVYNSLGQLQMQQMINQGTWINTSSWSTGVYWIQLNEGDKVYTRQLVVQ